MKKIVAVSMVALILVIVPLMLVAQEKKGHEKMHGGQLGLDEKTREVIANLKIEHRIKVIDLRAEMMKLRLQIKQEWMSEKPSQDKLNKLTKQIGDLRTEIQKSRIDFLFEAKKNLTDEQWKKFLRHHKHMGREGMMKRRAGRMHKRHGRTRGECRMHGSGIKASGGGHMHMHGDLLYDEDIDDEDLHLE
jgi:hypothetical protein